ncbi:STAS domain-containing protein [Catenovulum sediminis]|uniref:STAS domain-containing protein n=1 Tax=Catenovulum sediminis TaxID=1740262 RepID=A0ABV1RCN8_9ALTE|nr:STAS domain-containing protein [Catenovulum sediminis]
MNASTEFFEPTTYITRDCLVVPINQELSIKNALHIQRLLLQEVAIKKPVGAIIDLSGVCIVDSALWQVFYQTAKMIQTQGYACVFAGLSPAVVVAIIELDVNTENVNFALQLESALEMLVNK